ncbi:MAG: OmpA family protein [candidate division KSB1 bacterium]|nr:OmpA family protein [candidate division KSB1 bacterium]MDZ7342507.1 OmpA family protein [candidate division KSB1 bacterium]
MNRNDVRAAVVILFWVTCLNWSMAQDLSDHYTIGLLGGPVKMIGGAVDRSTIEQWAGAHLGYYFDRSLALHASVAYGWVYPKAISGSQFEPVGNFKTILAPVDLHLTYRLPNNSRLRPFVSLGTGLILWDIRRLSGELDLFSRGVSVSGSQINATLIGGMGFEFIPSPHLALSLLVNYHRLLKGDEDTIGFGDDGNNGIAEVRLGLSYLVKIVHDLDRDGIEDKYDLDPQHPEDVDGFQDNDGAPDPDNDNDGIPDIRDKSPNEPEDHDGFQDSDGIPDPDNDGDKIPDKDDKCANEPEDFDGFEDFDGCPDLDNDKDGIPDSLDQCPNWPEDFNNYQDEDGCPDSKPEPAPEPETTSDPAPIQIGQNIILKGITFEPASSNLTPESYAILNALAQQLLQYPRIEIEIQGHTDSIGEADANLRLSERRANTVRMYLIEQGINPGRLQAVGYGETRPIASNTTKQGRAANRRIEFVRLK